MNLQRFHVRFSPEDSSSRNFPENTNKRNGAVRTFLAIVALFFWWHGLVVNQNQGLISVSVAAEKKTFPSRVSSGEHHYPRP